jgi:RNA polymerase sigma factor (sigma-70 family)
MEPDRGATGVRSVSSIDPLLARLDLPSARDAGDDLDVRVPSDEPVVAPGRLAGSPAEMTMQPRAAETAAEFHDFYAEARTSVGRALAITLGDRDLATDAVDEALVRAYQRWERVRTLDQPAGWVYRVGLNHARSRLRRLLRRPPATRDEHVEIHVSDPAIERALARLSVDQRAVVVCRHLLGWSEAQTAEALHVRPGTVKSRLSRALTRLEAELHHLRPEDRP